MRGQILMVVCPSLLLGLTGLPACDGGPDEASYGYDVRPTNATCKAPPRPSTEMGVKLDQVWKEIPFSSPVAFMQAPGEPGRYYVVEQAGKVRAMKLGDTTAVDVVSYTGSDIVAGGEMGLLGLAFAPDWVTSRTAYISRTIPGGATGQQSQLSRIKSSDDGLTFNRSTEKVLLTVEQPFTNHKGGNIAFGPDGFLYFGLGDGGSGGDPMGNGQNTNTLLGKMLRLDVSGDGDYKVPTDNPFVGVSNKRPEIWAYGLRNPWRWSFDRATGELWVGDVGQNTYEEIDVVTRGGNYGWNVREGLHCYNADTCDHTGMIDPVWEYTHADGISVTGGFVYRGAAIPALVGTYVFSDYGSGKLWGLFPAATNGALQARELLTAGFNVSSFGEGADGELYMVDLGGKIWKLDPSGTAGAIGFPNKLSQTGCVDPSDRTKPAVGIIPYFVNVPFWSDGADKQRFIALPDGKQATILSDGDLDLPSGTVLVKNFLVGKKPIETRLFMRHDDGVWAGYTYEWDDDGKDATLVLGGKKKALSDTQSWVYPSGAQCLQCHNEAAGHSLGLELRQLNLVTDYPATNRRSPQLETWAHIGLFDGPLPFDADLGGVTDGGISPSVQQPLPIVSGPQAVVSIDARARAYLHSNCAFCHRPNGPGRGPHDLRFERTFKETMLCNTPPTEGNLGVSGALLLTPGKPSTSLVSLRMHALDDKRMPPVGSLVVDDTGVGVVDDWIKSLTACPQ